MTTDITPEEINMILELQGLKLRDLLKLAKEAGVSEQELDDVTDSEDPQSALINLLITS